MNRKITSYSSRRRPGNTTAPDKGFALDSVAWHIAKRGTFQTPSRSVVAIGIMRTVCASFLSKTLIAIMPFTPTHILAIVPLWPWRRWLPINALAAGAMIPDLPMFFPVCDYSHTHSTWGVLTVCMPWGLTVFLLFELIMRQPIIALLPIWMARRISLQSRIPSAPRLMPHVLYFTGAATAVALGAFSHQIWDAFSHKGRWGTQLFPILEAQLQIGAMKVAGYKLVQYGSTFVGLPLLLLLAALQLQQARPDNKHRMLKPRTRLLVAALISSVPVIIGGRFFATYRSTYLALGDTITSSGTVIAAGLVTYSLLFHWFVANNRTATSAE